MTDKESKKMDFSKEIKIAVKALWKIQEEYMNKTSLFGNSSFIFLQVVLLKVPQVEDDFVKRKILLKHPVFGEQPEICLFVRDVLKNNPMKKTDDELIDATIEKYEKILQKQKITSITKIVPLKQLITEYQTFELRRKFVDHFDLFLCSSKLMSKFNFFDSLGKSFIKKCKCPLPVHLAKLSDDYDPRFNSYIQNAILSTVYYIKPSSDNYSIKVGNMSQKKNEVIENLTTVIEKIIHSDYLIPGGFSNVRSLSIKCEKSKSVPIYINMGSGNKIPVPYVPSNAGGHRSVEGELSTCPGKKVTVLPSGDVFLKKLKQYNKKNKKAPKGVEKDEGIEDDDDYDDDDEDDDDEDRDINMDEDVEDVKQTDFKSETGKKGKKIIAKDDSEDDSEGEGIDEEIERAEQKYLSNLNEESEEEEEEEKAQKQIKKMKGKKRKQTTPASNVKAKKLKKDVKVKEKKLKKDVKVKEKKLKEDVKVKEKKLKKDVKHNKKKLGDKKKIGKLYKTPKSKNLSK